MTGGQAGWNDLTRVSLLHIYRQLDVYLRFGEPLYTLRVDRQHRIAVFMPGAVFCRIRWHANDHGTVRWQLMVMQACAASTAAQRIAGVSPGASLMLHAEGAAAVRSVLLRIDAIERRSIPLAKVSTVYWQTLANRLAAHMPLPDYTPERHAGWLAGRLP